MKNLNRIARWAIHAVVSVTCLSSALAEVPKDEAARLTGLGLTPWGAEQAANKEGIIPAYTGNRLTPPAAWDPNNPERRLDPFGEKPLLTITAQNAAQYADKLDGMIDLFKHYPDYRMDIYPTHRTWGLPQYVLNNTAKNLSACKASDKHQLKLEGCYGGLPFPIPKTGNEVMWNHLLSYQAGSIKSKVENWLVPSKGNAVMVMSGQATYNWPFYDPTMPGPRPSNSLYMRFLGTLETPARSAGGQLLIHEALDQQNIGRKAWLYMTVRRWVKIAADIGYDKPNAFLGIATVDDAFGFNGALDRYNFKMVGKKEKFIYYNNFDLANRNACPAEKLTATKHYPNPACIRWELHRVWVVEATLKPGAKHLYHKRIFYWDEDSFAAGQVENYGANKLFRINNVISYPYFEAPGGYAAGNVFQDIETGTYAASAFGSCAKCGSRPISERIPESVFSPDSLFGIGGR